MFDEHESPHKVGIVIDVTEYESIGPVYVLFEYQHRALEGVFAAHAQQKFLALGFSVLTVPLRGEALLHLSATNKQYQGDTFRIAGSQGLRKVRVMI